MTHPSRQTDRLHCPIAKLNVKSITVHPIQDGISLCSHFYIKGFGLVNIYDKCHVTWLLNHSKLKHYYTADAGLKHLKVSIITVAKSSFSVTFSFLSDTTYEIKFPLISL